MKNKKRQTFIYEGLGFPIKLIKAPMKKVFGEWFIDLDMNKLQLFVLNALAYKPSSLTGAELRFIRKYLRMTTTDFGKLFGVSHVAVVKWENEHNRTSPSLELYIRLYVLNHLHAKDKEFRALYNAFSLEQLSKSRAEKSSPLSLDATKKLEGRIDPAIFMAKSGRHRSSKSL
jgi:DNA-binding transcriptional regulator YiaG